MSKWRKLGRHLVADWARGSMQVIRDDKDGEKSFRFEVFAHGILTANGRAKTLAGAQRMATEHTTNVLGRDAT